MSPGGVSWSVRSTSLEDRVLVSTNNIQSGPFFSPDGEWVGFKGWDALRKVPVAGGAATTLVDRIFPAGTWSGEDIYYGETRGLFRVAAAGGEPVELLATTGRGTDRLGGSDPRPRGSPVHGNSHPGKRSGHGQPACPRRESKRWTCAPGAVMSCCAEVDARDSRRPGHLLYASGGTLYAIAFDPKRLQTRGKSVAVVETEGLIDFDVSAQGTLFYQAVQPPQDRQTGVGRPAGS